MSDSDTHSGQAADRATWLRGLRRENERQEDALAHKYEARWGEIEDTHRAFVERFLSMLPPDARVLDAACGTGKYSASCVVEMATATRHSARFPSRQ